jgi:hypothetical protein
MDKAPCKGCEERYVGCHSKCRKYIDYKTNLDMINKSKRMASEVAYVGFRRQQDLKINRELKHKRGN